MTIQNLNNHSCESNEFFKGMHNISDLYEVLLNIQINDDVKVFKQTIPKDPEFFERDSNQIVNPISINSNNMHNKSLIEMDVSQILKRLEKELIS